MANTYRTPGVYVEEIVKFPPSVAAVETAIPAFIGYTEIAKEKVDDDLLRKPKRITAIADYELFFGQPDFEKGFEANITDEIDPVTGLLVRNVSVPKPATMSKFLMYYSVRMYFANGGGPCYIISVGKYYDSGGTVTPIALEDLGNNSTGTGGLDLLELEDEPTLIVFPDATGLPEPKYYSLCQAALAQCNKLQDRFAIFDTYGDAPSAPSLFRNSIGTEFLKYGAVYYPFLETVLNYAYKKMDVVIHQTMLAIFSLPATILGVVNTEKGKVDTAATAIAAVDLATPKAAVNAATTKATKATALNSQMKPAVLAVKAQVDLIVTSLQLIITKANELNNAYHDPDVTDALEKIDIAIYTSYSTALENNRVTIEDAFANQANYTQAQMDQLAADPVDLVSNTGPVKDMLENLNDLRTLLLPALIATITGNDPTQLIANVNAGNINAKAARLSIDVVSPNTAALVAAVTGASSDANAKTALTGPLNTANTTVNTEVGKLITALTLVQTNLEDASEISFLKGLLSSTKPFILANINTLKATFVALAAKITDINNNVPAPATRVEIDKAATDFGDAMAEVAIELNTIFINLTNIVNVINYLNIDGLTLEDIKQIDNNTYNQVILEIEGIYVVLPPSSSIAGKYAQVDRDRGVWKAPANVSLSSVTGPTKKVSNDIQDGLNIDPVAGKSVNVIRTFTGKGTMVWGARTLSGNDNEWRYVPVRRFFIYAEESTKKACDQFVFEGNNATTWVKVRAMIENWLILQWRAGALVGAKPEEAFYVHIGLGQTMTAVDILEGRMNVEIGLAVVRPAEFIILRFSHKMQES